MVTVLDVSRIRNEDDLYAGVQDVAGFVFTRVTDDEGVEYDSAKFSHNCSIVTQQPTKSATATPTNAPTTAYHGSERVADMADTQGVPGGRCVPRRPV